MGRAGPAGRATAVLIALAALAVPRPVKAQGLIAGGIGGALGLAGGGLVSVGIVTWRAQHGEYLYSIRDALGWQSSPVLIGGGVGLLLGVTDQDRLRNTVIAGLAGGAVGAGVGILVGGDVWRPPEGKWAGGVIGAAAGLLAGGVVGMLLPTGGDGGEPEPGVPLTIRIPF